MPRYRRTFTNRTGQPHSLIEAAETLLFPTWPTGEHQFTCQRGAPPFRIKGNLSTIQHRNSTDLLLASFCQGNKNANNPTHTHTIHKENATLPVGLGFGFCHDCTGCTQHAAPGCYGHRRAVCVCGKTRKIALKTRRENPAPHTRLWTVTTLVRESVRCCANAVAGDSFSGFFLRNREFRLRVVADRL